MRSPTDLAQTFQRVGGCTVQLALVCLVERTVSKLSPKCWKNCKVNAAAASGRNWKLTGRSRPFSPRSCLPVFLEPPLLAGIHTEPAGQAGACRAESQVRQCKAEYKRTAWAESET